MALYNLRANELPWVEQLPEGWNVKPLYSFCELRQGKAHEPYVEDTGEYVCVNSRFISTEGKKVKNCTEKLTDARLNDILMVMSDLPNGRALAKGYFVEKNPEKLAVNQRVCAITVSGAVPKFLHYQMSRSPYFLQFDDGVNQTHLSNYAFQRYPALLPDIETQEAIATFLDSETLRIDSLISEKQRFIELLKEKRQALISHVVTKGLDANVEMKDSGVEWIGRVPAHWTCSALKVCLSIKNGRDYKEVETDNLEDSYPVYGSGGEFRRATDYLYEGESILFGRKGTVDKPLHVSGRFWTVDTMFYSEVKNGFFPRFLYYTALTIPFSFYQTNTALPSMTQGDLLNNPVAYPDLKEQIAIVEHLDKESAKFDFLMHETNRSIELLKEHRSALISAAVTGKIDVRGFDNKGTAV